MAKLMNPFRWQGAVAFVLIMGLLSACYWLFADWLIKRAIEQTGSQFVGAKVELDAAELKLLDGTLTLHRLQVTNASAPMRNLIEIAEIHTVLDTGQLWWQRLHLNTVAVKGIRFGTERSESGAIAGAGPSGVMKLLPEVATLDWQALASSDGVEGLLGDLELESLAAVDALQAELSSTEQRLQERRKALPGSEQIASYEARAKALKIDRSAGRTEQAMALIRNAGEIDALRKDIKRDAAAVRALRDEVINSREQLKSRYQQVRAAPQKDLDRALGLLNVNVPGSEGIVSGVLGPELENQLGQGMAFYQSAEPWINRARILAGQDPNAPPPPARFAGVIVHFPERDPQPAFWLKSAALDGELDWLGWQGRFAGEITDVSDSPLLVSEPSRLTLDGQGAAGGSLTLLAVLDRRQSAAVADATLKFQQLALPSLVLSQRPELALTANKAELAGQLTAHQAGDALRLSTELSFSDVALSVTSNNDKALVQAIVEELAKTDAFQLSYLFERQGEAITRTLHSSLDDTVKTAVRRALGRELDKKKQELRAKLETKVQAELASLDAAWQQLLQLDPELSGQLQQLDGLLPKK